MLLSSSAQESTPLACKLLRLTWLRTILAAYSGCNQAVYAARGACEAEARHSVRVWTKSGARRTVTIPAA